MSRLGEGCPNHLALALIMMLVLFTTGIAKHDCDISRSITKFVRCRTFLNIVPQYSRKLPRQLEGQQQPGYDLCLCRRSSNEKLP